MANLNGNVVRFKVMHQNSVRNNRSSSDLASSYNEASHMPEFIADQPNNVVGGLIKQPIVIIMVGLPARGKTYMSTKLARYLNWIGVHTKLFNVGQYRRREAGNTFPSHDFFRNDNDEAMKIREKACLLAINDMKKWLSEAEDSTSYGVGRAAIFDATNSTRRRRKFIIDSLSDTQEPLSYALFFIESICDDASVIETNIREVKTASPDYKGFASEDVVSDFRKRIEHYERSYEPLDPIHDAELCYLKVIDIGRRLVANRVVGNIQSRIVYFLMNCTFVPHTIYLTRHGESEFNLKGKIGGDSALSENGERFSRELAKWMREHGPSDLSVWTSVLQRTRQTAHHFDFCTVESWKALNEIDAGVCDGWTYEEMYDRLPEELAHRDANKYYYRYPQGESYQDLVGRLEPVIMELERRSNVLVICHQAVARCILAYFRNDAPESLPYLNVPLHTVIKITTRGYGCDVQNISLEIPAINTHRSKPEIENVFHSAEQTLGSGEDSGLSRSREEALATVPAHI